MAEPNRRGSNRKRSTTTKQKVQAPAHHDRSPDRLARVAERVHADETRLASMFDEASHFRDTAMMMATGLKTICLSASYQPWRYSARDAKDIKSLIGELLTLLRSAEIEPAPEVKERLQRRIDASRDLTLQALLARAENKADRRHP